MTHIEYIAWSYAAVAIGVLGLGLYIWLDLRRQTKHLADLEQRGLSRRRPAFQPTKE